MMLTRVTNQTNGESKWKDRVDKLVTHGFSTFFPKEICYEPFCEASESCTTDMKSFKGYVHRWYASATKVAPYLTDRVMPMLEKSAGAAIKCCTGSDTNKCGFSWVSGSFDGVTGAGPEMNALGALSSLLVGDAPAPVTAASGGISKGDPNAGSDSNNFLHEAHPITVGDKAGAGILTAVVLGSAVGMFGWMSFGDA